MPTEADWEAAAKIYNAEANKGATEAVLIALGVEYGRAQSTIEAPPAESEFARRVRAELICARAFHPPIHSLHEGLAVIQEEVFEFQREVYLRGGERSNHDILKELVQSAAMCQRTAEDCGLIPGAKDATE